MADWPKIKAEYIRRYVKIPPEPGGRRRKSREPYYRN